MKQTKIFLIILLIFVIGISCGGMLSFFIFSGAEKADAEAKISENPKTLEFVTTHTLCNHVSKYTEKQKQNFSSESDIQKTFPEWTLRSVTNEKIVLDRKLPDFCDKHYFVQLSGKYIVIQTRNGDLKEKLSTSSLSLTEEERTKLKEGLYLNGEQALCAFIEDFTS